MRAACSSLFSSSARWSGWRRSGRSTSPSSTGPGASRPRMRSPRRWWCSPDPPFSRPGFRPSSSGRAALWQTLSRANYPGGVGELTQRRRMLILGICCLSLLIVGMDVTIVNVALNSIRDDLHASLTDLQWTIDAYTVVLASLLMLSGSTADRLGRRRVFQVGLTLFTVGSLLCSIAPSLGWLVAFRAVQAIGGSMLNPVAMSIITNTFTEPRERARAIGVWGGVVGISLALGPVLGGALVASLGWRSIFWINIPVGVAAVVLTAVFVPESRAARARRVDPVGQLLVLLVLATLTYAIIEGPD